jgi:hypothetical protein
VSAGDGFERLAQILERIGTRLPAEIDNGVVRIGAATLGQLKLRASGRPGPRRVTGDYTRKMNMQADHGANGVEVTVGGAGVQGPRLEFGFHGADSLGRRYNQPPFPHYAPTFLWLNTMLDSQVPDWVGRAVSGA